MRLLRLAPVVLAPLLLLACGEAGDTEGADTASMDAELDSAAMADSARQSGSLELEAKNQSGVTGTAHTEPAPGDSAVVVLELDGLDEGSEYPAHVHQGTCDEGGPVAAALNAVTGGADGTGTSRTTLSTTQFEDTLRYFLQAHLPDGAPAACADVPAASPQDSAAAGGGEVDASGGGDV